MKKVIAFSVVLIVVLAVISAVFVPEYLGEEAAQAAPLVVKNGEFTYPSMITGEDASYTFYYNEGWFGESAGKFNSELAQMSIRVSMAATSTESESIQKLFSALEFDSANMKINYPAPTRDSIGYALGHKKVADSTLILCAVRGGGYGAEWVDNFNIGTEGNHLGFETQAQKVKTALDDYIKENSIDKNKVKVWITGFSRGAVTTNIAAHYLSETYGSDNVYAYCFECPRGVDKSNINSVDKNIFNIINDIDFITYMAPEGWNFGRYGIDCYLPSEATTADYAGIKNKMSLEYGKIYTAAKYGIDNIDREFSYVSPETDGQAELINDIFTSITTTMSRQEAEDNLFAGIRDTLTKYMESNTVEIAVDELVIECTTKLIRSIGTEALVLYLKTGMNFNEFAGAITKTVDSHYPELCLAWMDTSDGLEMITESEARLIVNSNEEINFTDVSADDYYYEPVLWATSNGISPGESDHSFAPETACTRAQIITFMWRAGGSQMPKSGKSPFEDVTEDKYYYNAVLWAVENGIANGTTESTFSPHETVTRGQAVTFLWRKEKPSQTGGQNVFTDVDENAYYRDAVLWAASKGITQGTGETTFSPGELCTRGQIITFLYRGTK